MKYNSLSNLPSYQNQNQDQAKEDKNKKGKKVNKNYGTQARMAAMQNTQRASGRRGN